MAKIRRSWAKLSVTASKQLALLPFVQKFGSDRLFFTLPRQDEPWRMLIAAVSDVGLDQNPACLQISVQFASRTYLSGKPCVFEPVYHLPFSWNFLILRFAS
jgi:hypothetical protein